MVSQPLNMFQRLVRSWEAVHPFNAAQVIKVGHVPLPAVVQHAWHGALTALGLGRVRQDGRTFSFELLNREVERYPVRMLPETTCLAEFLTGEMNRAFDDPAEPPFRPFIIPSPDGFYLGLVYRHWVADSVAIRSLLREWCARLFDPTLAMPTSSRHAPGYWDLFGPRQGGPDIDQTALGLFRNYIRFRTVQKVCMTGIGDYPARVLLGALPDGVVDSIRTTAHSHGATVGDALQAALAQACHRHVPLQRRPSRRDVAIGNIIDLRPHARCDLSDVFGMFLGFSHVVCRREDLNDFPRLLNSVSLQNRVRRRDGVAQMSIAWMLAASIAHRFNRPEALYRFYRKELPLAAGLSNVNLAGSWAQRLHPFPLLDYIRISPTGPMTPISLSATTLGARMSLALTYRPALLDERGAADFLRCVIERVLNLT